ncbi:YdcF family protein [Mangrovivirga sp. M17]|uniref:YdcF family protein n=1 Tax=Mangrovivirga halotolerans TaxID=2993936 RepID=A0ABT3RWE9_9BACT|nr:ElyC/SanA/YdcF family protein [Mangrovivirga halotolerans]MCX2746108.1 YdcF family protein [Mangrovivirga halotolerans]
MQRALTGFFIFLIFAVVITFFQTLTPLFLLEKHKVISAFQFLDQKYPAIHFLTNYNALKSFFDGLDLSSLLRNIELDLSEYRVKNFLYGQVLFMVHNLFWILVIELPVISYISGFINKKKKKKRSKNAKSGDKEVGLSYRSPVYYWLKVFGFPIGFLTICILISNMLIVIQSAGNLESSPEDIEMKAPVLVLGTNKFLKDGVSKNAYYENRMEMAASLYRTGKASFFILSGDNSSKSYNEPALMRQSLMQRGVPGEIIELDYAGRNTLGSVVRLKDHNVKDVIIISQKFHLRRAIPIAEYHGYNVVGLEAKGGMTLRMFVRELIARFKVHLDLYIFNTKPIYSGTFSGPDLNMKQNKSDYNLFVIVVFVNLLSILATSFVIGYSYSNRLNKRNGRSTGKNNRRTK